MIFIHILVIIWKERAYFVIISIIHQNTYRSILIIIKLKMKSYRFILTILLLLLIIIESNDEMQANPAEPKPTSSFSQRHPNVTLDLQIDQLQLQNVQSQSNKQQQQQLDAWIAEELKNSKSLRDLQKSQSFIIHLYPDQTYEYLWELNDPQSIKRSYQLLLNVYTHQGGKDITFVRHPQQDSFTTVQIKSAMQDAYSQLGKVYMTRTYTVFFAQNEKSKIIRFTNFNSFPILLQVSMEIQIKHLQLVKETIALDKHFQMAVQKINAVFQQAEQTDKTRTQSYKWEWGFLQRQERYQDEMLRLTGVQLFAILVTAIIQMYCLKNLLQNKQIV